MNALGAEKCSKYLAELLQEYELPDRRGQEGYESWDEAYEYYKEVNADAIETIWDHIEKGEFAER